RGPARGPRGPAALAARPRAGRDALARPRGADPGGGRLPRPRDRRGRGAEGLTAATRLWLDSARRFRKRFWNGHQTITTMAPERTTIRELARRSGVSIGTVSRALNGYADVNPETRERIMRLAEELDYTPSASARTLVTQRSHVVGVFLDTG